MAKQFTIELVLREGPAEKIILRRQTIQSLILDGNSRENQDEAIKEFKKWADAKICTSMCFDNYCPVHGIEAMKKII